jgi:hypothetical protein
MAIHEFSPEGSSKGASRRKIGVLGYIPPSSDLRQFEIRGFKCEEMTLEKLKQPETIAELVALIWTQRSERPNELPRQLGEIVPALLDRDVRVYIRLAKDAEIRFAAEDEIRFEKEGKIRPSMARQLVVDALRARGIPTATLYPAEWRALPPDFQEREGSHFMPSVYIFDATAAWPDIATIVCDHPAGRRPKLNLNFDPKVLEEAFQGSEGHAERALLLQRAFWDCSDLDLFFLPGGLSGASVGKAYACLEAGQVGAYPHLYFFKIGSRKKIIAEHDNYGSYILEYVPFHLAPRLRPDRCNLGSTQGILVGDFVEGTESLISCARSGRYGHAISNLFDRTLVGWRKQPREDPEQTLASHLVAKWRKEGEDAPIVLPESRASIVKGLGGWTELRPLKDIFEKHARTTPLCAPAHGDMHATNVLVRHGDAIIIDFEKMEPHYPLTYDPASLEGGMLVEGFVKDLKKKKSKKAITPKNLLKLLTPLYTTKALIKRVEPSCARGSPAEWYFDCVNQIRMRSWSAEQERGQYALTLALCLIRKGCNTSDKFTKEQDILRAIAFFFGQSILRELESDPNLIGEKAA